MIADPLLLICLLIVTVCAVVATAALVLTSRDVRRAARRFSAILPRVEQGTRDMRRALEHVRRLTARADRAAERVGTVVDHACETAEGMLEHVGGLQERAQASLGKWFGNGAGAASRRHHRSR